MVDFVVYFRLNLKQHKTKPTDVAKQLSRLILPFFIYIRKQIFINFLGRLYILLKLLRQVVDQFFLIDLIFHLDIYWYLILSQLN